MEAGNSNEAGSSSGWDYQPMASKPTFDQVPMQQLTERVDNGNSCVEGLLHVFKSRLELEEKNMVYATKISRVNLFELEVKGTSTEKALGYLKNYHLALSKENFSYHKKLQDDILKRLDAVKSYRTNDVSKHKTNVQTVNRDVAAANEGLTKAKQAFAKAQMEYEASKMKLSDKEQAVKEAEKIDEKRKEKEKESQNGSKFSMRGFVSSLVETTPEQEREKYNKQMRKVAKCRKHVYDCTGDIVAKKKVLAQKIEERDNVIQMAVVAFQAAEFERISQVGTSLKKFCELEKASIAKRSKFLATLEAAVDAVNSEDDVASFIEKEKKPEQTHKYAKAISLLDWGFDRRHFALQEHKTAQYGNSRMQRKTYRNISVAEMFADQDNVFGAGGGGITSAAASAGRINDDLLDHEALGADDIHSHPVGHGKGLMALAMTSVLPLGQTSRKPFTNVDSISDSVSVQSDDDEEALLEGAMQAMGIESRPVVDHTGGSGGSRQGTPDLAEPIELSDGDKVQKVLRRLFFGAQCDIPVATPVRPGINSVLDALLGSQPDSPQPTPPTGDFDDPQSPVAATVLDSSLQTAGAEAEAEFLPADSTAENGSVEDSEYTKAETSAQGGAQVESEAAPVVPLHPLMILATSSLSTAAAVGASVTDGSDGLDGPDGSEYPLSTGDWALLLHADDARAVFLQQLDEMRCRHDLLSAEVYMTMVHAMEAFLDRCLALSDVHAAMRIANMANTFHKIEEVQAPQSVGETQPMDTTAGAAEGSCGSSSKHGSPGGSPGGSTGGSKSGSSSGRRRKSDDGRRYLQEESTLRDHPIWRSEGFWDTALLEGVAMELDRRNAEEAVLWDELSMDALWEAVIDVHNIVFGQLVGMTSIMNQVGLGCNEVEKRMLEMSSGFQLAEDQEQDLMRCVRRNFGLKEMLAPASVAQVAAVDANGGAGAHLMDNTQSSSSTMAFADRAFISAAVHSVLLEGAAVAGRGDDQVLTDEELTSQHAIQESSLDAGTAEVLLASSPVTVRQRAVSSGGAATSPGSAAASGTRLRTVSDSGGPDSPSAKGSLPRAANVAVEGDEVYTVL